MHFQIFDLIVAGAAHIALIAIGLSAFFLVSGKLTAQLKHAPTYQLFLIFGIYGGLSLMILHSLTWPYSGMAFLGYFATIIIAPIIAALVSYSLRQLRKESKSHQTLFLLGLLYIPIAAILYGATFLIIVIFDGNI